MTSPSTIEAVAEAIESRWTANGASTWEIANLAIQAYLDSPEMNGLLEALRRISELPQRFSTEMGATSEECAIYYQSALTSAQIIAEKALIPFTTESTEE